MKRLIALAVAVVVTVSLVGCGTANKPSDTIAVPASSSDLKGENYKDVMTRLKTAGFASIETASIDDLVLGWLAKDGDVERVSVNGETKFDADSRFPKGAKIVITYHTFPKKEPEKSAESDPVQSETPDSGTKEADDTILTLQNSKELSAVLKAENPGDPEVQAFIKNYAGRSIAFDGYTWDWINSPGYKTMYSTNIYVGDVKNADTISVGPIFRVERYQWPNFVPALNRMNVHVKATVDGYDADHEFFQITPTSLEAR